jgi:hypothetical protein
LNSQTNAAVAFPLFTNQWSAKAEYLYTEFKHDDLPDRKAAKFHSFRVGVTAISTCSAERDRERVGFCDPALCRD